MRREEQMSACFGLYLQFSIPRAPLSAMAALENSLRYPRWRDGGRRRADICFRDILHGRYPVKSCQLSSFRSNIGNRERAIFNAYAFSSVASIEARESLTLL